jgi:hypothetical protein
LLEKAASKGPVGEKSVFRDPMWAREAVEGLVHGSAAEAGAGRDRQSDRDLTLGWVSAYESAVCKEKKEISGELLQDFTGSRRSVCATLVSS